MTYQELEAMVEGIFRQIEDTYVTGSFREYAIKDDLQSKKLFDNMHGTNRVWEKKQFYFEDFDYTTKSIDDIINKLQLSKEHKWFCKFEEYKSLLAKLREIVQNF